MATKTPTFAELVDKQVVANLATYREFVRRGAAGEALADGDALEVGRLLRELELPSWCFRRDVDAVRNMDSATSDYRRQELAWIYPHLFADRIQWAQLRKNERAARRRAMAQLREAAVGK